MLRRKKKKKSYAFLHIKRAYRRGQGHEPIRRSDSPMRRSRCRLRRRDARTCELRTRRCPEFLSGR